MANTRFAPIFTHSTYPANNSCWFFLAESSGAANYSSGVISDGENHALHAGLAAAAVDVEGGGGALDVEPVDEDGGGGHLVAKVRGGGSAAGCNAQLVLLASHVGSVDVGLVD